MEAVGLEEIGRLRFVLIVEELRRGAGLLAALTGGGRLT
jgi:hypothetical protein